MTPYVLYSDGQGNVYEDTSLYACGRSGHFAYPVAQEDWIALPEGGSLYELENRRTIGIDVETGEMRACELGWAVAAFIPPAHTGLYMSAYMNLPDAPVLPLFCYTAVGWWEGEFFVTAVRVEDDIRQEAGGFDREKMRAGIEEMRVRFPKNRIVDHLADNCALTYTCPAASNYFLGRWECPVPTSPACNSNCLGCISLQPEDEVIVSSHDRLQFKPTAGEIMEYCVDHLQRAPYPLISFGQGCEGEPLLMGDVLADAIRQIRKFTDKGSININTNGSRPDMVELMCKAGLNSIRVSTNSLQKSLYDPYYRPNNYTFDDVIESLRIVKRYGGWTSINYFIFPGMTDTEDEINALRWLIKEVDLDMIQWRNFNIDPDWYLDRVGVAETPPHYGIKVLMEMLREEFPRLRFGYYNPPIERIKGDFSVDFAR